MNFRINLYSRKTLWKTTLLIFAIIISSFSLIVTNNLVKKLEYEERKKVELWAEGMRQLASTENLNQDISFLFMVIKNNETVPVIVVDQNDSILSYRNFDSLKIASNPLYLNEQLNEMKHGYPPIEINLSDNTKQFVYYKDSLILSQLSYYPYIQLAVFFIFIFISYLAFSSIRKSEQNQVWMGMAKETAHQLGTPISSLMAWLEWMKSTPSIEKEMLQEIQNDINRLQLIAERFSKIGSAAKPETTNIISVIKNVTDYMQKRTSSSVQYQLHFNQLTEVSIPIIVPLFEWVLENIYKNAVDAMNGKGIIEVTVRDNVQNIYIDIKDTGKGIPKSKQKIIFKPGYTTKTRGWGLGLSLTKRIIEEYHQGKIFVKSSEINQGTTFRIVLFRK
ncbi:MAG: HAMP domain-containing histidine kinase [Bacteroidales bacterium]|nr:HAMP domain-containing histidine kinase [Bacteroidales bacterium]